MYYIKPEMEILLFEMQDIVTSSYTEGETQVPVLDADYNGEEW